MVLNPEIERGLRAVCWFCDREFVKAIYCHVCGFYRCGWCGKCACDIPRDITADKVREMLMKTVIAMAGRPGAGRP